MEIHQRLTVLSEDNFYDGFNMKKQRVVEPGAVRNLADIRECTRALGSEGTSNDICIIHAEIWASSLAFTSGLHNLIAKILREGGVPSDDSRVRDYLAALNIISLQYGSLFVINGSAHLSWHLIHNEGLEMHAVLGGATPRQRSSFLYEVALSFAGEIEAEKILFFLPDGLITYLDQNQAESAIEETKVRGYNVKVNYTTVSAQDQEMKKEAIAKVIFQSLKSQLS